MRLTVLAWRAAALLTSSAAAAPGPGPPSYPLATNVQQLRQWAQKQGRTVYSLRLEGVVCAVGAVPGTLVLGDDSGAELLEVEAEGPRLSPGDRVRLEGQGCSVSAAGSGLAVRRQAVVDNDGVHGIFRKEGKVYLGAGWHPLRLLWFNHLGQSALRVSFQGPGLERQTIPDTALFRAERDPATGRTNRVQGLDYRCYEGRWANLSAGFGRAHAVKAGHTANFDLGVCTRDELVGLEFSGYLVVPREGVYTFETESDDASRLWIGDQEPRLAWLGSAPRPSPRRGRVGQVLRADEEDRWCEVEGTVALASEAGTSLHLELRTDTGRMAVVVNDGAGLAATQLLHRRLQALGVGRAAYSLDGERVLGSLSVLSGVDIQPLEAAPDGGPGLPLLTTVEQVTHLKREEAQRGYPVRLRGVVTRAVPDSIVIQDATRGVWVGGLPPRRSGAPQFGEYWEIEGTTAPGDFAPVVVWRQGVRLGTGRLPEPVAATWDQLINGSLERQYVELEGVVTAELTNRLELRLRDGKVKLGFFGYRSGALKRYENAHVRVRGCLLPAWDRATHQVNVGEINISGGTISIEEEAPKDLFAAPAKRAAELLLFDPRAGALQRVKVAGQFLCAWDGQCFLTDGTRGLRFQPGSEPDLVPGDLIEVVGFLELGGASPLLCEALARKTGHAALPEARPLREEDWLDAGHDATRVRVEGWLVNQRTASSEQVLELRTGGRTIVARLNTKEQPAGSLQVGSRLGLTGVYAARGGERALGRGIDSFELLLASAADLRVLTRAPWLTLPRLLAAFGAAAVVLLAAMLWALSLRRQVSAQTVIIRQKAEREAALEERARIAKDIHDDVGASLTSIMMLGERAREDIGKPRELAGHTDKIVSYSRATVQALDEIVWAVNPRNDTLDALVGYLGQYASQFFDATDVRCRLDVPERLSSLVLPPKTRHDLYLVVKEALNNVLKHAQASEVCVGIEEAGGVLEVTIADNGRGFDPGTAAGANGGDGLTNMRKRMEKIRGGFCLESVPGQGTRLKLTVRLGGESAARASNH